MKQKGAVAGRAITCLKNIIDCYLEENGDKYVNKIHNIVIYMKI